MWNCRFTRADLEARGMPVQSLSTDGAQAVLHFWFDEVGKDGWFANSKRIDGMIGKRFGALRDEVFATKAEAWRDTPHSTLAAIILLDQFSRNLHRGSAKAFAADPMALSLTMLALERDWDAGMSPEQRQFLLLPLMHSEKLRDQQRSLFEYAKLGDGDVLQFAQLHFDQIAKFGRFPGRNAALGRRSTGAEQEALDNGAAF